MSKGNEVFVQNDFERQLTMIETTNDQTLVGARPFSDILSFKKWGKLRNDHENLIEF